MATQVTTTQLMNDKLAVISKNTRTNRNQLSPITDANLYDLSPVDGLGAISRISGGIDKSSEWFSDVTFTYANASGGTTRLMIGDAIGSIAAETGLTFVNPDTCDFNGSYAVFKKFIESRGCGFKGFNYTVDNVAQQSSPFKYYWTSGDSLHSKRINPKAYTRNTPNDPKILTFETPVWLNLTQGLVLEVQNGRTVTITLYSQDIQGSYSKQ